MSMFKIHHGDCLPYMQSFGAETIDCIVTDPPFGTNFKNDIYDDSSKKVGSLIPLWYSEWFRVLKPQSFCFVFCGILNVNVWIDEALKAGFTYRNMIATRSFTRGGLAAKGNFCFEFQPVLVLSKGKGRKFNKVDFFPQSPEWRKDKRNKNPSDYTYSYSNWIPSTIAYGTEKFGCVKDKVFHPNAKSEKLCRFFIEIATNQGEYVLDPFNGSGTTGAAAVSCGRRYIGIEQDEHWAKASEIRISQCLKENCCENNNQMVLGL